MKIQSATGLRRTTWLWGSCSAAAVAALLLLSVLWPGEPVAYSQAAEPKDELVYINLNGTIQVLDPVQANGTSDVPRIVWQSPITDGVWSDVAVGDFTADGDDDIVAVRPELTAGMNLAIYDPVIAATNLLTPGQVTTDPAFNLVPWRRVAALQIDGQPWLVAAGDFDPTTPGDEIFYSYRINDPDNTVTGPDYRMQIIRRTPGDTRGEQWQPLMAPVATDVRWERWTVGQLDAVGAEELALVGVEGNDRTAVLAIYQVEGAVLTLLNEKRSQERPWHDAAIGRFSLDDNFGGVAAVRRVDNELPSFWIFKYDPNRGDKFADYYQERFNPSPRRVFVADYNANGDQEVFLLRDSLRPPPTPTPSPGLWPNLIMRNPSAGVVRPFEVVLDADSGYREGIGMQHDADAFDELVVARDNRFLIFYQPEVDTKAIVNDDIGFAAALRVGNLDAQGIVRFPELAAAPVQVARLADVQIRPGQLEAAEYPLEIFAEYLPSNVQSVEFSITVPGNPDWMTVEPTNGLLPQRLTVKFATSGLVPLSTLQATIVISVLNNDSFVITTLEVPVTVHVLPGLYPQPAAITAFAPCAPAEPLTGAEPYTTELAIQGLIGVPFTTLIEPAQPAWLAYAPTTGVLPATLSLTISPDNRSAPYTSEQVALRINAKNNQGQDLSTTVPIRIACGADRILLPLVNSQ